MTKPLVWTSTFTVSWCEETLWSGVKDIQGEILLPMSYERPCQPLVTGGIRYLNYPALRHVASAVMTSMPAESPSEFHKGCEVLGGRRRTGAG